MQAPNKVKFADVSPDTREKAKIFLSTLKIKKCTVEGRKVKTLEDAIMFSIKQAERVPALEEENSQLRAENFVLEKDKGLLLEDLQKCKMKIAELNDEIENLNSAIDGMAAFERERSEEVSSGMYRGD